MTTDQAAFGLLVYLCAATVISATLICCHSPWKVQTPGQQVILSKPWTRRIGVYLLSLFFAVAPPVLMFMGEVTDTGPQREANREAGYLLWFLCLLLALGGFYLAAPETTVVDLTQRTFRFNRLWPGQNSHFSGPISEINDISVKRISSPKGGTYYCIRVVWRAPNHPHITLGVFNNESSANQEATRITEILQLGRPDDTSIS